MTLTAARRFVPAPARARLRGALDGADARFVRAVGRVRERLTTPAIALTFDDGPDPESTPRVLDALARLGAPATFFLVGRQAARHPTLVARIVEAGHAIGSHSYDHPDPWTLPLRPLVGNYRAGRHAVEDAAGEPVTRFRPPKGFIDRTGAIAARAAGVSTTWLWTVDPHDWMPGARPDTIAATVAEAGSVWLLHDAIQPPVPAAADRSATIAALDPIVRTARAAGRQLVVLPA